MDGAVDEEVVQGFLVALVVVVPVGTVLFLRRRPEPLPIGGVLVVVASWLAAAVVAQPPVAVFAGAVVAGLGGAAGSQLRPPGLVRALLVLPGATLAVVALPSEGDWWFVPAGIVVAAVSGPLADVVDTRYGRTGLAMAMLAVAAGGVYVTVPDTGLVAPVFGAVAAAGLLVWPATSVRLGPGGGSAGVVLLAALTVSGGWTRPGAVVGGLLAPGLLAVLALVPRPDPVDVDRPWPKLAVALLALGLVVTLGVTRVAGLQDSAWSAAAVAVVALGVGWWVARRIVRRSRPAVVELAAGGVAVVAVAAIVLARLIGDEPLPAAPLPCPDRPFTDSVPAASESTGPIALYPLDAGSGTLVADDAGDLELAIGDAEEVVWEDGGGLTFLGGAARVVSSDRAVGLADRVARTDEVSVEVWLAPMELPQSGPARVLTVSDGIDPDDVNLHVGIDGRRISFRVRTDCDSYNWTRSDDVLAEGLHHVVASYRPGAATLWLDGSVVTRAHKPVGILDNWDPAMHLYLGDEATADRPFRGTLRRAAVYDRALTDADVAGLYAAGPEPS